LDEARLPAAGRPLQHDRHAVPRGGGKKPDFALRLDVEGFLLDPVSLNLEFVAFAGHGVITSNGVADSGC
jgi:hypothetical protein